MNVPLSLLVLGTHNRGKRAELATLLAPLAIEVRMLDDFAIVLEVEETGDSFEANARLKACVQAAHLRKWVLAEDSGLSVDFLGGAPGVYSARYSGAGATDASNNEKLLAALAGVPLEKRGAHYVCHAVLADPMGQVVAEGRGECHGRILDAAAGSGGFGYDPLFLIPEYHRTFGELSHVVKDFLSHRARALRQMLPHIAALATRRDS